MSRCTLLYLVLLHFFSIAPIHTGIWHVVLIKESSLFCTVTGDKTWVNHAASATNQSTIHDIENPQAYLVKATQSGLSWKLFWGLLMHVSCGFA